MVNGVVFLSGVNLFIGEGGIWMFKVLVIERVIECPLPPHIVDSLRYLISYNIEWLGLELLKRAMIS